MEILSVAWRTDLALLAASGSKVDDRGGYLVVRTPDNPGFWWGNFILLRRVPMRRDVANWIRVFEQELPDVAHRTFGIDDPSAREESLRPFSEAGFTVSLGAALTAIEVSPPPRPAVGFDVRRLAGDADWDARVALSHAVFGTPAAYRDFAERRAAAERRLADAGLGEWFGAFDGARMVAGLGIFAAGADVARFQSVETHPDFRRRGLAATLVHHAARHALDTLGVRQLVIVSESAGSARRIYESVGFRATERQPTAELAPRS